MAHHHTSNQSIIKVSFFIIAGFMLVEAVGGWLTDSLALLSDAGHMLSDAASLGMAWLAFHLASKASDAKRTFGYKRAEILAAALNGIMLIVLSLIIIIEAIRRLYHPEQVEAEGMLAIAVLGLLVNIFVAWYMHRGGDTHENLNMRGAFWHVIGDLLGSVAAIIAAVLIMAFGWTWSDPFASIIVSILIAFSGVRITRDALHILMEGTPIGLDTSAIASAITQVEHVHSVHDLHVWTITSGQHALSCHVSVDGNLTVNEIGKIQDAISHVAAAHHIGHTTVQIEAANHCDDDALFCTLPDETHSHGHNH